MLRLDTIGRNMQIQCYSTVNIHSQEVWGNDTERDVG